MSGDTKGQSSMGPTAGTANVRSPKGRESPDPSVAHGRQGALPGRVVLDLSPRDALAVAQTLHHAIKSGSLRDAPYDHVAAVNNATRDLAEQVRTFTTESETGAVVLGRGRWAREDVTSAELAARLSRSTQRVGQLAAELGVGTKRSGRWYFTAEEAEQIAQRQRRRGAA